MNPAATKLFRKAILTLFVRSGVILKHLKNKIWLMLKQTSISFIITLSAVFVAQLKLTANQIVSISWTFLPFAPAGI